MSDSGAIDPRASGASAAGNPSSKRGDSHLLHYETSRAVIGAMYIVHDQLGPGFFEKVYANALGVVLRHAGLPVAREVPFTIMFHGEQIGFYRADLVVDERIVVEVKAARAIEAAHFAQVRNYLRASGLELGFLLNFGRRPQFRRVIETLGHHSLGDPQV